MSETYCVRLDKEQHVFSAAHFITYDGDVCERLHGHNYRVSVEVDGPLDENQYVVDFIALCDALKSVLDELDHRMLLPTKHPLITVSSDGQEVEVRFQDRRWIFPQDNCLLLPVANTTASAAISSPSIVRTPATTPSRVTISRTSAREATVAPARAARSASPVTNRWGLMLAASG